MRRLRGKKIERTATGKNPASIRSAPAESHSRIFKKAPTGHNFPIDASLQK
jgi:hypothetical protein